MDGVTLGIFLYNIYFYKYKSYIISQSMDNCTLDCIWSNGHLNYTEMCQYTVKQCHQGMVQFVQGYYCSFNSSFMLLIFVGIPLFLLLFKILNVIASSYLSPCVEEFITQFKISPTLAGVTFLAFANGAPDVMTAVIAGSSDSKSTALIPFGSIFGAFLCSAALILSQVILAQPIQTIRVKQRQFVIPLVFYLVSIVFILIVALAYKKMNAILASVLLIIYLIYIVIVMKTDKKQQQVQNKQPLLTQQSQIIKQEEQQNQDNQTSYKPLSPVKYRLKKKPQKSIITIVNEFLDKILNTILEYLLPFYKQQQWDPTKVIISLIISPFIISLTQKVPDIFTDMLGPIPVFLLISLPAIALLAYAIYCIIIREKPKYFKPFTVYSFLVSVCALTTVVFVLVNFVELIQILTGMNPVFLGLTVFAWANSIGDYLTIIHFAKKGNPKTAIAGIFSGQLFNFSLGFGISLIIQSLDGEYDYVIFDFEGTIYDKLSDGIVMTVILSGIIYLVFLLVMIVKKKGILMGKQAMFARWFYVGFMIVTCILAILSDFFDLLFCHYSPTELSIGSQL